MNYFWTSTNNDLNIRTIQDLHWKMQKPEDKSDFKKLNVEKISIWKLLRSRSGRVKRQWWNAGHLRMWFQDWPSSKHQSKLMQQLQSLEVKHWCRHTFNTHLTHGRELPRFKGGKPTKETFIWLKNYIEKTVTAFSTAKGNSNCNGTKI